MFSQDSDDEKNVQADTPEMRSILIRSSPAPAAGALLSHNDTIKQDPDLDMTYFNLLPSFQQNAVAEKLGYKSANAFESDITFRRHSSQAKDMAAASDQLKRAAMPKMPQRASMSKIPSWKLETIPKVPEYYLLGRTKTVVPNCDGTEIASRITECLREHSLSVVFDENTAVCETPCHTKFIVKIFDDEEQFVVEVQRRNGSSIVCQKHSRAILRAAKGSKAVPQQTRSFPIPASILKQKQESKTAKKEEVQNALKLINQEKYDVKLLGTSALISITEKRKIEVEDSDFDFLAKYILSQPRNDSPDAKLRLDSLTLLANLLAQKSIQTQYVTEKGLLQLLVTDLVHVNPHFAYQAARCITALCRVCPAFKRNIAALGANTVLDQAEEKGSLQHKLLENEVMLLKQTL